MRRWIELAAALYPAHWRAEYGDEFQEVVANAPPNWRTLRNVLGGAIAMQMTKGANWLKWIAVTAALGAGLAAAFSFALQAQMYSSSVTLEMKPAPDPVRPAPPQVFEQRASAQLFEEEQEILSRTTLANIIMDPQLDLYKSERGRIPMEDIVALMRNDIHIQLLPVEGDALKPVRISVSFTYPDPYKAQAVARRLAVIFSEQNLVVNRNRELIYQVFWQEMRKTDVAKATVPPPPAGAKLTVVSPPGLPRRTDNGRAVVVALGAAAGALLGMLFLLVRRRRRGYLVLAGAAAAGLLVGGGLSFLAPDRNTSNAVMRIAPPIVMADPLATPAVVTAAEALRHFEPEVLADPIIEGIIVRVDLYPEERRRQPLEQVAQRMREHDIQITPAPLFGNPGASSAFQISFTYSDPLKAQQVVRWLVAHFTSQNVIEAREKARTMSVVEQEIEEHKAGQTLEVLDPPSLPLAPVSPNRPAIAAAGAALGLLVGMIALWRFPTRIAAAKSA